MRPSSEPKGSSVMSFPDTEVRGQLDLNGIDVEGTLREHEERADSVLGVLQAHGGALQRVESALQRLEGKIDEVLSRLPSAQE